MLKGMKMEKKLSDLGCWDILRSATDRNTDRQQEIKDQSGLPLNLMAIIPIMANHLRLRKLNDSILHTHFLHY